MKKYIYILWKTSNFEVVGWKILELRKAISKYLHKCRPKEFGDEGEREERRGEKTVIFFYFVFFFFWLLHEVEEISISVLYRNNSGGTVQI